MRRDDGLTRIRIDTDDPSCQNELLEKLLRHNFGEGASAGIQSPGDGPPE